MIPAAQGKTILTILACALLLSCAWKSYAADELSVMKGEQGSYTHFTAFGQDYEYTQLYQDWISGHLEIGLRYIDYNFKRRFSSGSNDQYFIGSIQAIEAEDPGVGLRNLNMVWFPWAGASRDSSSRVAGLIRILEGVGIELGWDEVRAKTITPAKAGNPAYSDGTIVAKGPILSYVYRFDNPTRITPYLGIGTVFYSTSVTEGWWHWGFPNEAAYSEWRAAGSPGDPNGGLRRTFKLNDQNGLCWYAGAAVQVYSNWSVDLFYRNTEAEFDNTYEISSHDSVVDSRHSKWDLSNETYGIGVRYTF